jgi:hypothetical protein
MSETEKPSGAGHAAPVDPLAGYVALAEKIFVSLAARVYSSPAEKKPDPKTLAIMSFKMADAFEAASKETDRARAIIEARNKAAVKLDEVDLSGVFASTKK